MQLSLGLDDRHRLRRIHTRLEAALGPPRERLRLDPVSQLVRAVISSRTRDEVSSAAFDRLRRRYRAWDGLRMAAAEDIERTILPVTFADRKARHLSQSLRRIAARRGSLDLDFLADWDMETARRWLLDLPGIGPKVAASVLNFSTLRRRILVVDTHLLRVGQRLGLVSPRADYAMGHAQFMRLVPDDWDADDLEAWHRLVKGLGQRVCTSAAPACTSCPLGDLCACGPHGGVTIRAGSAAGPRATDGSW